MTRDYTPKDGTRSNLESVDHPFPTIAIRPTAGILQSTAMRKVPRMIWPGARGLPTALRDPRLSTAGNWLAKHLTQALEALTRVESWLRTPNERGLQARDCQIVQPLLARVGDEASLVAELVLGPDLERARLP